MSDFKDRLTLFLKEEGLSKSEFARIMGLSPAYVGSMRKSMPAEKVKKLLEHFPQLSRDWLLHGEGPMYVAEEPETHTRQRDEYIVPLIPSDAAAGYLQHYSEGVDFSECELVRSPVSGATCAIRVRGDSMEPRIHSGDLLFLERINERAFIPWGKALVLDTENGTLVKRLLPCRENPDCVEVESYNPAYPRYEIPKSSIYGIYRIKATVGGEET